MSTSAAAQAASATAPGPIDPTATFRFSSRDGTELYGEWFAVDAPRAAALVVHGYAEHCGRYRELAHVLTGAGLAVLTYDMRGHGRAEGQRGHIGSTADYLDDLDAALQELDERLRQSGASPDLPRILVGHSNGGLVTLRALTDPSRKPPPLAAAVLSSPFLGFRTKVSPLKDAVGRLASRWLPTLSMPIDIPVEHLTSDPAKQEERRLDTLCHDVASSRWYTATQEAQAHVAEHASQIDIPTLWLVSGADRLADPAATRLVHGRVRTPGTYHDLAEMEHEVFNEHDRGRVFDLLRAFLNQIFLER